jgi:hypothetical protein
MKSLYGFLTLPALKRRGFLNRPSPAFKGIVKLPLDAQNNCLTTLQLRLLVLFSTFRVHQISYHAPRSTIACLPRLRSCRDETNQESHLIKSFLCADGYSYSCLDHSTFGEYCRRINSLVSPFFTALKRRGFQAFRTSLVNRTFFVAAGPPLILIEPTIVLPS